jgi:hypothetical protein
MPDALVDQIARAVLYEGHILYPYRTSVKNRQRWTFGGLYPRSYCEGEAGGDAWAMQTQGLVHGNPSTNLRVTVRFLHPLARRVGRLDPPLREWPQDREPHYQFVESLQVGPRQIPSWQEAVERSVTLEPSTLGELLAEPRRQKFAFGGSRILEPVCEPEGQFVGVIVREQEPIAGVLELSAEALQDELFRVTLGIQNHSVWENSDGGRRDQAVLRSLMSTHTVLEIEGGEFVSLMDPPAAWAGCASDCQNVGTWPVLVGSPGDKRTLLSAPIILYDYPQIAPESPGDLFDGTEIDEILTLRILTLTDEEKQAMAGLEERSRALLERTESLAPAELLKLHGVLRTPPAGAADSVVMSPWNPWEDRPGLSSVRVAGRELKPGNRVRLHPGGRADIFDLALDGKSARIESIEQDFEDQIQLAVVIDDDPGRDLGQQRLPAHRFFFRLSEVEPLPDEIP